jgi:hypothetical protein
MDENIADPFAGKTSIPLSFTAGGKDYRGVARAVSSSCSEENCDEFDVVLNDEPLGSIYRGNDGKWQLRNAANSDLVNKIGEEISIWLSA